MADTLNKTQPVGSRNQLSPAVRRFRLVVLEGPDTGTAWESTDERCSIGQERGNELVLTDTTVSRFHCELEATDHGVERAAASDVTVLFEGETGTGKSQAARAIPSLFAGKLIARVGLATKKPAEFIISATRWPPSSSDRSMLNSTASVEKKGSSVPPAVGLTISTSVTRQVKVKGLRRDLPYVAV